VGHRLERLDELVAQLYDQSGLTTLPKDIVEERRMIILQEELDRIEGQVDQVKVGSLLFLVLLRADICSHIHHRLSPKVQQTKRSVRTFVAICISIPTTCNGVEPHCCGENPGGPFATHNDCMRSRLF